MQNQIAFALFSIAVVLLPVASIVLFELYLKDQAKLFMNEVVQIVSKNRINYT